MPATRTERLIAWTLLAAPSLPMCLPVLLSDEPPRFAVAPTGEAAAILLVAALSLSPLRRLLPRLGWLEWVLRRRRWIGVAAFYYAALHMIFFCASIGRLDYILIGLAWASMWTGWLAFLLLVPMAATSNDAAVRRLGPNWKRLQRVGYIAALLVLAHWLLLTREPEAAFLWFAPLAVLQALRLARNAFHLRRSTKHGDPE